MTKKYSEKQSNDLAEMITKARTSKGYSHMDLASLIGVSIKQIGKYEKGKCFPPEMRLKLMCSVLDIEERMFVPYEELAPENSIEREKSLVVEGVGDAIFQPTLGDDIYEQLLTMNNHLERISSSLKPHIQPELGLPT